MEAEEKGSPRKSPAKKTKVEAYKLSREQKSLIKADELNKKVWGEAMESLSLGPVSRGLQGLVHLLVHSHRVSYTHAHVFILLHTHSLKKKQ